MTFKVPFRSDAQIESAVQELLQGLEPVTQGLEPGTQGSAPDVTSLHPDNPARPQRAYRAVKASLGPRSTPRFGRATSQRGRPGGDPRWGRAR